MGRPVPPTASDQLANTEIPKGERHGPGPILRWSLEGPDRILSRSYPAGFIGQVLERLMPAAKKARAVGVNHIALEVGDITEALAFYGRLFDFELRGKSNTSAFIDLGDQFLALQKGRAQPPDDGRHFGLVVDDKEAVRRALADAGIEPLPAFSIFATLGATASRSSATTTSSSPRRRTYCAPWDWRICQRTRRRSKSLPTRA
jgi:predicted enzyme related to lactoylglutathione lyase